MFQTRGTWKPEWRSWSSLFILNKVTDSQLLWDVNGEGSNELWILWVKRNLVIHGLRDTYFLYLSVQYSLRLAKKMIGYHKVVYFSHWVAIVSALPHCLSLFFPSSHPLLLLWLPFLSPLLTIHPSLLELYWWCGVWVQKDSRHQPLPWNMVWGRNGHLSSTPWARQVGAARNRLAIWRWPYGWCETCSHKNERRGSTPLNETPTKNMELEAGIPV